MSATLTPPAAKPPPLRHGERMDFDTFVRRWEAHPSDLRAELIGGEVRLMAAVRANLHAEPDNMLCGWLGVYRWRTGRGVRAYSNGTIRLSDFDGPQPDSAMMLRPECGGQAFVNTHDYVEGSPELVIEIAASSIDRDMGERLTLYRDHGIRECIVWRTEEGALDWFALARGVHPPRQLEPDAAGVVRSEVFPGLWLDVPALLADDERVLDTLQLGLASPEHAAFKQQLGERTAGGT